MNEENANPKVQSIMFFPSGQSAVFDANGQQIGELQKSWLLLWAEHAHRLGYRVDGIIIKMPDGRNAKLFKTSAITFNWEFC